MKKDFILMGAGIGMMNLKMPSAYLAEEHFDNAERLSRRKSFGMGDTVLDILEPIKKIVDKILNNNNYMIRDEQTSKVVRAFSEKLQNEFDYKPAPRYNHSNKLGM